MPSTNYHLLPEVEPFSEFDGGAISRWAGNVLRNDSNSVVVCRSADDSWKFARESILELPEMKRYTRLLRYLLRLWPLHHALIRHIFRPVLKRIQPGDIVWIHNRPHYALALTGVVHRAGGRVVLHLQNSHLIHIPKRLLLRNQTDRLTFISEFLLQEARRKFPTLGASSVLYSGADETIFYPPAGGRQSTDTPTVLFVGRLVQEKGVHILVDAMKLLEEQGVNLRAQIVGSSNFGTGEETDYIRDLKAKSPRAVEFVPYCSGVALGDLFRKADIFCSPSVWEEPFGLVNVEALASGLPVVSTRSGGVTEILAGGGGILVERGSVAQLAGALRRLAENTELRRQLGQQGLAVFRERFTWSIARAEVQQIQTMLSTGEGSSLFSESGALWNDVRV
jgi:spore coat protein SA